MAALPVSGGSMTSYYTPITSSLSLNFGTVVLSGVSGTKDYVFSGSSIKSSDVPIFGAVDNNVQPTFLSGVCSDGSVQITLTHNQTGQVAYSGVQKTLNLYRVDLSTP